VVNLCLVPIRLQISLMRFDMNCEPLSLVSISGAPLRDINSSTSFFAIVSSSMSGIAQASLHFVNQSTRTSMYWFPSLVMVSGPNKSIPIISIGLEAMIE